MDSISWQERDQLLWVAGHIVRDTDSKEMSEISGSIESAFELWALAQADADGLIPVQMTVTSPGDEKHPMVQTVSRHWDSFEPWELGAQDVRNGIDLAFKLCADAFPAFKKVSDKYGHSRVFAVLGFLYDDARAASLIRLNGYLTLLLATEAVEWEISARANVSKARKHDRQIAPLVDGRKKAAESRSERAQALRSMARQMAIDYRVHYPDEGDDAVIRHLRTFEQFKLWKGVSALTQAVKGTKRLALARIAAKSR